MNIIYAKSTEFSSLSNIENTVSKRITMLTEQLKRKTSDDFGIHITIEKDDRGYTIRSIAYIKKEKI